MSIVHNRLHLFIDFDGTISTEDTVDLLLARFAEPRWEVVEAAWQRGEIGSLDCLAQQVALLSMTPEDLRASIGDIPVDPYAADFIAQCHRAGFSVTVLSDGLDVVARGVLGGMGIDVPVISNRLEWSGGGRWRLGFPHAWHGCASAAGNCKCRTVAASAAGAVLIGDGRSDYCAADLAAEMVFAKGKLLAHCRAQGIRHVAFADFGDLLAGGPAWSLLDAMADEGRGAPSYRQAMH